MQNEKPAQKNLNYLLFKMEKLSYDINDKEICRRFRTFIANVPFDITEEHLRQLKMYNSIYEEKTIHESILPFYKHYIFMSVRAKQEKYSIA